MRLRIYAFLLVLGLVVIVTSCEQKEKSVAGANGERSQTVTITLSTVQLDKQQMGIMGTRIQQMVKERLGDRVNLRYYPGAQLYSGVEELEALKKNDIQICLAIGSTMGALDSGMSLFKLPFLFPNVDVAYQVLDGPVGRKIFEKIESAGITIVGGFASGSVFVSSGEKLLTTPDDFKGKKMRTSGKMEAAIAESLGSISVVLPSEDTYSGLQQRIVDGIITPSSVFSARHYYEVQKYVTNAGLLYWPIGFVLTNSEFWNTLPTDIGSELNNIINEAIQMAREECEKNLQDTLQNLKDEGVTVHTLTAEEASRWKEVSSSVLDQYKESIGSSLVDAVSIEVADLTGKSSN